MRENAQTVSDLILRIRTANVEEFKVIERTLASDTRITVQRALDVARKRIQAEQAEHARVQKLYSYQSKLLDGKVAMGLDEVGRGPLAGPLSVGAVVLDTSTIIEGLNDSKQVSETQRDAIAQSIKESACAYAVCHVPASEIDSIGMAACLRKAFSQAIEAIDKQLAGVEVVLIDGNPLHIDERESNVVHGDALCASIAAASILAKVERDHIMQDYAQEFPLYGFDRNKGYASSQHQDAIRCHGLSPIHRSSFCGAFLQQSLF